MTPATVGDVFGGARVDMSVEETLKAATALGPDRLTGVDEMVISLAAKGFTTGVISGLNEASGM